MTTVRWARLYCPFRSWAIVVTLHDDAAHLKSERSLPWTYLQNLCQVSREATDAGALRLQSGYSEFE